MIHFEISKGNQILEAKCDFKSRFPDIEVRDKGSKVSRRQPIGQDFQILKTQSRAPGPGLKWVTSKFQE